MLLCPVPLPPKNPRNWFWCHYPCAFPNYFLGDELGNFLALCCYFWCHCLFFSGTFWNPNHWYFLDKRIAGTNGRRIAVPIGGVLQYKLELYCGVSLSSRLRSQRGTALQMGGVLRYNLEAYRQYPSAQNQYMQEKILGELIFAPIQENIFWGAIFLIFPIFGGGEFMSVQIHAAPVFTPARIQENFPEQFPFFAKLTWRSPDPPTLALFFCFEKREAPKETRVFSSRTPKILGKGRKTHKKTRKIGKQKKQGP